ncbi:MAG TPA: hypothetical protein VIH90_05990 [Candidatus Saccharimonadales bacterium]
MRIVNNIITLTLLAMVVALPLSSGSAVFADNRTSPLQCSHPVYLEEQISDGQKCDLSVDKQVSVNGSAFVDAPTSASAVQAHVGDSVVWKITVTN